MEPEPKRCTGDDIAQTICAAVSALRPLYAEGEEDRPEGLLRAHPDPTRIVEAHRMLIDAMFPGRAAPDGVADDELGVFLLRRLSAAWRLLRAELEKAIPFRWRSAAAEDAARKNRVDPREEAPRVLRAFLDRLPDVRNLLIEDVRAAYEGDPAALSFAEVQLAYPGLLAITSHRLAHELHRLQVPIIPRVMSEWTHAQTGVDIHPGAEIGHGFFIDHATGVVIGETARIGNRVKIYQGVTLGACSFALDESGHPIKHVHRHPRVEDDVIIYANATILGGDTVIGRGSVVGGNVFLMESVPPNSFVATRHTELQIKPRRDRT